MTDSTIKHIATVFPVNAEALRPDPHLPRRRSIIREFSLNTTTHGIPSIARSQNIYNRIFWTVSFIIYTGIMIYFITETIRAYFGYPTQTSVSVVTERSQLFPGVSVCNYSPIRYDLFIEPFLNYTNSRGVTNTTDTETISYYQAGFIRDYIEYMFNTNQSVTKFLYPLESMLMYCSYNGQPCNSSNFISFSSSTYGSCYTFNIQMKNQDNTVRKTTDHGGTGILELRMYAHSQQYVPYVSEDVSAGIVAMIHDNTELPLIDIAGIKLAPGRKHQLAYRKRTYQTLQSPYSNCTTNIPPYMQAMFDQYSGADYVYSSDVCYTLCIQAYVYQECGCADPYEWTARNVFIPGTDQIILAPLCNQSDPCFTNAETKIADTDSIWNAFCSDCSPSCSVVEFTVTTSSVAAPSITQMFMTKSFVEQSNITLTQNWSETWRTEILQNYVSLQVVCESRRVEQYVDSPSIEWVDLLSNIGGLTGLWIGMSFLSLMEVIEMLYRLIQYHYYMLKRRLQTATTTNDYL